MREAGMNRKLTNLLRAASVGLLAVALAVEGGCQSSSADQCSAGPSGDADCDRILGLSLGQAFCDDGTCRPKATPPPAAGNDGGPQGCVSTEQCTAENGGRASICPEPGVKPCVVLANDLCDVSGEGYKQAKDPIFVGVLINKTILAENDAVQPYDTVVEKDIKMAEAEWLNATNGGLNIGGERRPIVNVYCDIKYDPDTARAAYDHVTLGVGAQAVITESPEDIYPYIDDAKTRGTFFYLTEFGSDEVAATGKLNGLVYTNYPAITYSLPLMKEWVKHLETKIRADRGLSATDKIKVVTLGPRDVDSSTSGYLDKLKDLEINGAPASTQPESYREVNPLSTIDGSATDYFATAQAIATFAPDLIVTLEARDFHLWYLPLIEASWPSATPRPLYVTTESAAFPRRYAVSVAGNEELRHRVGGIWQALYDDNGVLGDFLSRYQSYYKEENVDFVISGFDAFYSTAYGIAGALTTSTVQGAKLTGSDIGEALKSRLQSGTVTKLAPGEIPAALATLQQGGSIDLDGATGPLDWEPLTGASGVDSAVYCVGRAPDQSLTIVENGLYFREKTHAIEGVANPNACP
jgi:branched-chain amino acid transport system substrate-binding protein